MTRAAEPPDAAFSRLFDLSLDVLCVTGFDGYLRSFNRAYVRLLGYSQEELLAKPFAELIHPDDLAAAEEVMTKSARGEEVLGFECRSVCADGSVRWLEWNTRPVPDAGLMYSVGRDITDRRMADDELRALRRIATFVAEAVEPEDLFAIVAEEVARVMGVSLASIARYEPDGSATECARFVADRPGVSDRRIHWSLEGTNVLDLVLRTGEAARINDYSQLPGQQAEANRRFGIRSTVGVPVIVAGRLWGVVVVSSVEPDPLPDDTEDRLADFTQLLATAIANAESRDALAQLAAEQAALRRVATLAVQGVPPTEILAAVSDEVDGLFGTAALVLRFDPDGTGVIFAAISKSIVIPEGIEVSLGTRWAFEDAMASAEVYRTGRPARSDQVDWASRDSPAATAGTAQGVVSSVASPIVVQGHLWGAMLVYSTDDLLPMDTEPRLEKFTDLVATVIANAESRDALKQLADEQAALRRVATLVARGVPAGQVFQAVSQEVGDLLGTDTAYVSRFEDDGPALVTMGVIASDPDAMVGARWELDDSMSTAMVYRTGRSARVDDADWAAVTAHVATVGRRRRTASAVSSPITVEGRLWGAVSVAAPAPLPADTADRLEKFTGLLSTAIANAQNKAELSASRRRIVAASDRARRKIERDLHDGTQQRLVALGLALRAAEADAPSDAGELHAELSRIAAGVTDAVTELQEISRGIHPPILARRGLDPALRMLARRSLVPVELDLTVDGRLPDAVEIAAYYVASEAIANVAKHARASLIEVTAARHDGTLQLTIRDDGVGGVDPAAGSGLVGLTDRVAALGGSIQIASRRNQGTRITAEIPVTIDLVEEPD